MARLVVAALCLGLAPTPTCLGAEPTDGTVPNKWAYRPNANCQGTFESPCGPTQWSELQGNAACGEQGTQSPINIIQTGSVANGAANIKTQELPVGMHALEMITNDTTFCPQATYLLNAHTAEVEFVHTCPNYFRVKWGIYEYKLAQYHIHSPSEHAIDGRLFPMEIHFVHVPVYDAHVRTGMAEHMVEHGNSETHSAVLVIAEIVVVGASPSPQEAFLNEFFDKVPQANAVANPNSNFYEVVRSYGRNPYDLLVDKRFSAPFPQTQYYAYNGSFTTPPCTTNAQWIIAGEHMTISQATLNKFRTMVSAVPHNQLVSGPAPLFRDNSSWDISLGMNNRPLQVLSGPNGIREVLRVMADPASNAAALGANSSGASGLAWWAWALIVIGSLLFVVAVIGIICAKRAQGRGKQRGLAGRRHPTGSQGDDTAYNMQRFSYNDASKEGAPLLQQPGMGQQQQQQPQTQPQLQSGPGSFIPTPQYHSQPPQTQQFHQQPPQTQQYLPLPQVSPYAPTQQYLMPTSNALQMPQR